MKIAHLADIHIRNIERHDEYRKVFSKIYDELNIIKPDRIVISGDLYENFIEISNEAKILSGEFLNNLANIAKVIITRGNHDIRKKNSNRIDSVETIIKLINNSNINYYNKTDFYNDSKITWVVYDHIDKYNDPWLNVTKDNEQIYIGLYHDPIYGCSSDVGKVFDDKKYKDISYFKNNDFMMLGDIHKFQTFRKNESAAYCGSTIQQNFGESVEPHGFLLWDIKSKTDFTLTHINIPNDHTFLNLYISESSDYDNLNLTSSGYGTDLEIKVHWTDYSSNITTANEKKIRDHIKDNFNTTKIIFDKTYIYNDVISSKMLSETLDLTDLKVQASIFNEYLIEQKYNKSDIDDILKIDDIINGRLQLSETVNKIEWSIDKFWFSNFKSYGDDNIIDWKDIDGIVQINGLNTAGKTSVLDAITYILYGKTTTTLSPEKFGDTRYINNKRQLDFCNGGAVIDVNGEKFIIERRTERIWSRNKDKITACSTTLEYYKDAIISDDNKLTGEVKKKTQQMLDSILGDIKDFIRLSYTNADNLNAILSETRSIFIDNIIRDAGYDIFEHKLEEFKNYKKELSEEKIIIDVQESEALMVKLKTDIEELKGEMILNKTQIDDFEIELSEHNINRDDLNKKLNVLDSKMNSFNESINYNSIENYNQKIKDSNDHILAIEHELELLPTSFDPKNLNLLKINLKEANDKISKIKDDISNMKNNLVESDSKIDKVLSKIKDLKTSEVNKMQFKINDNNLTIEKINNEKKNIINLEINSIKSEIQKNELKHNDISNNIKVLQKDGLLLKKNNEELDAEIKELENSTSCPTCGREYDKSDPKFSEHILHLEDSIKYKVNKKNLNNVIIREYLTEYKKYKNELTILDKDILELNTKIKDLKSGVFSDEIKTKLSLVGDTISLKLENEQLKNIINEIYDDKFENVPTLNENIIKGNNLIEKYKKEKSDNVIVIKNLELELKKINIEGIENDIEKEENKKDNYELKSKKESQKEHLILSIENFNLKINELNNEIEKYQEYKSKIEENKTIQFSIDRINEKIFIINDGIKDILENNNHLEKNILIKDTEIINISTKIRKYLKQKKKDELLKEYQKCISRDGLPTFLLKKSIHLLNKELNDLLSNVNFTLFFDENLVLRMSADDRLDVSQDAITSSGMERTFCALALKIALRQINVKSKPTFIFLDECMGKLISDSIHKFTDFLDDLKSKVNKIIIIEHVHDINYNTLIEIKKDVDLISHLELI